MDVKNVVKKFRTFLFWRRPLQDTVVRFNMGDGKFGAAYAQEDGVAFKEESTGNNERIGEWEWSSRIDLIESKNNLYLATWNFEIDIKLWLNPDSCNSNF